METIKNQPKFHFVSTAFAYETW